MSGHSRGTAPRSGRIRPVALVAAVCALAAAGGYTGALWVGGEDLDAVQINTGHLDVRILQGDERAVGGAQPLADGDDDGVSWFVSSTPRDPQTWEAAEGWTLVDTEKPLVYPGETWVAAIPFTVALEGDNLLADLSLRGGTVQDALSVGHADFTVAEGVVAPGQSFTPAGEPSSVALAGGFTISLPAQTQADDTATYTLLLAFEVPGTGDAGDLRTVVGDLDIVLQQNRSTEGGE